MALSKKTNLIGLDIGSRTIKAAEVHPSKGGGDLKKFGMIQIPPGAIEEGTVRDPDTVVRAIQKLFSDNKFKNKNIATSIGGYSVIVKKINVQNMSEDQLQDAIAYEAEQYIPFDINDVNLDFQILGENENNPRLRIALCGYEGEHDLPGWDCVAWSAGGGHGNRAGNQNRHRERIWFSPHCLGEEKQLQLFVA